MIEDDKLDNVPQEGTSAHDEYMRNQFGDDYEMGYRVGFGRRFGAALIDMIFSIIIGSLVITLTGAFSEIMQIQDLLNNLQQVSFILRDSSLISGLLVLLYYSTEIFLAASPGKMILGLVIGSSNRFEAETGQLVNRYLLKHSNSLFSMLALITTYFLFETFSNILFLVIAIGFFFTLSNKRQALHDTLSNTAVYFKENLKNY